MTFILVAFASSTASDHRRIPRWPSLGRFLFRRPFSAFVVTDSVFLASCSLRLFVCFASAGRCLPPQSGAPWSSRVMAVKANEERSTTFEYKCIGVVETASPERSTSSSTAGYRPLEAIGIRVAGPPLRWLRSIAVPSGTKGLAAESWTTSFPPMVARAKRRKASPVKRGLCRCLLSVRPKFAILIQEKRRFYCLLSGRIFFPLRWKGSFPVLSDSWRLLCVTK